MFFTTALLFGATLLSISTAAPSTSLTRRQDTYACGPGVASGIKLPAPESTIAQTADDNYDCTSVEVLYCSGEYFKTSSIDASVWLANPDSNTGMLLAKDVKPDDADAPAGYYSYRFNVSICPIDGSYMTGSKVLSVYETTTGYYSPQNYRLESVDVTLAVNGTAQR